MATSAPPGTLAELLREAAKPPANTTADLAIQAAADLAEEEGMDSLANGLRLLAAGHFRPLDQFPDLGWAWWNDPAEPEGWRGHWVLPMAVWDAMCLDQAAGPLYDHPAQARGAWWHDPADAMIAAAYAFAVAAARI